MRRRDKKSSSTKSLGAHISRFLCQAQGAFKHVNYRTPCDVCCYVLLISWRTAATPARLDRSWLRGWGEKMRRKMKRVKLAEEMSYVHEDKSGFTGFVGSGCRLWSTFFINSCVPLCGEAQPIQNRLTWSWATLSGKESRLSDNRSGTPEGCGCFWGLFGASPGKFRERHRRFEEIMICNSEMSGTVQGKSPLNLGSGAVT